MKTLSIKSLSTLIKYKVSLAVTFTSITGFIVYSGSISAHIITLACEVFILSGGSSALNEVQESKYDSEMPRTKYRPIPSGEISSANALLISILFILTGIYLLYSTFGILPALLGLFNVVWYNLFYTYLKRTTPFAVVPGSLVGAIPVFIGWSAAGGSIFESSIVFIGFFLFLWQIPHFWLLMLKYGNEYEQAGFPTINQRISQNSLKKIIFSWVMATSAISISIPLFFRNISLPFFLVIFVLNILFVITFARLSFGKIDDLNLKKSFIGINVYMILFMVLIIINHLVTS